MGNMLRLIWAATLAISGPAHSQDLSSPEFTPVCNECVGLLRWGAEDAAYYEVKLSDVTHPDGKKLIYKGPSTEAFVTISGPQVAEVRACNAGGCTGWVLMHLVPTSNMPESDLLGKLRITQPIELIHDAATEAEMPAVPGRAHEPRAVLLDLTATGQRGCAKGTGKRQWNIGTRTTIALTPDISLKVRNQSVVEHGDGWWTWVGTIVKEHEGTVTLTANDCEEAAYVSIESDAGDFAIQPTTAPNHVAYRVEQNVASYDCSVPIIGDTTPLIVLKDEQPPENFRTGAQSDGLYRHVSFNYDAFAAQIKPLRYLLGSDRGHNVEKFVNPLVSLELVPGIETKIDLRHGEVAVRGARYWNWSGCIAAKPDSKFHITVDNEGRTIQLALLAHDMQVHMSQSTGGQYLISIR